MPRVLSKDDDVTDHATSAEDLYSILFNWNNPYKKSAQSHVCHSIKFGERFRSFKIFHSEPLISQTQILKSAELVDHFDFSAKTLAKTYNNTFLIPNFKLQDL